MVRVARASRADSPGSMSPSLLLVEEQVQVPAEGTRGQRQWGYKFRPSWGGSKKLHKQSAMRGNQSDRFSEGSQCARGAQMTVQRQRAGGGSGQRNLPCAKRRWRTLRRSASFRAPRPASRGWPETSIERPAKGGGKRERATGLTRCGGRKGRGARGTFKILRQRKAESASCPGPM